MIFFFHVMSKVQAVKRGRVVIFSSTLGAIGLYSAFPCPKVNKPSAVCIFHVRGGSIHERADPDQRGAMWISRKL